MEANSTAVPPPLPPTPCLDVKGLRTILGGQRAGDLFQIMLTGAKLRDGPSWSPPWYGFFSLGRLDELQAELQRIRAARAVYITLNPLRADLKKAKGEALGHIIPALTGALVGNANVERRTRFVVDVDPVRPKGTCATESEHQAAVDMISAVEAGLTAAGWPEPIRMSSGNGRWLLYAVELPNDAAAASLLGRCLRALKRRHQTADCGCDLDLTVSSANQSCRLPGSLNAKGRHSVERPNRLCEVLHVPEDFRPVPQELLEGLAAQAPGPGRPKKTLTGSRGTLELDAWVEKAHLHNVRGPQAREGSELWTFDCPFNSDHVGKAHITHHADGGITAGCFHNSCTWGWDRLQKRTDLRALLPEVEPELLDKLRKNKNGGIKCVLANASLILEECEEAPHFWYDSFAGCIFEGDAMLEDHDLAALARWFGDRFDMHLSVELAFTAVRLVAHNRSRNPLQEWLQGLKWDGERRLAEWLVKAAGVAPTPVNKAMGGKYLIQAVARAMSPGCKADATLVLYGDQGDAPSAVRKSSLLKCLAGRSSVGYSYFTDTPVNLADKDTYLVIRRTWIYEFAELLSFQKSQQERIKSFLTSTEDVYREPYGRVTTTHKRSVVFAGTTNDKDFLKDPTGSRRYWPVAVTRMDLAWLQANREQLWAEAMHHYVKGTPPDGSDPPQTSYLWWLDPKEEIARRTAAEAYEEGDTLTESVVMQLEIIQEEGSIVTMAKLIDYLVLSHELRVARRIGGILKRLGWDSKSCRLEDRWGKVWYKK